MTVSEKVAYLKGLAEGLGIGGDSKEDKLIGVIIETLDLMADEIDSLNENQLDIGEELDVLSDDLAEVENIVYDDDWDEDDDCCCCDEDDMFSVVCPACNEEITLDESVLDMGEIECPNCGETLEFEFDEDDEEDED